MNLEMILGSAVVSAFISSLGAIYTSNKKNKLEYITKERSMWRAEIRLCAEEVRGASYQTTRKICDKLKVRINAWGRNVSNKCIDDAHIWKLIEQIESENFCMEDLPRLQEVMQEYLSLLLKWDWERSKKEVKGDKWSVVEYFLWGISFFVFMSGIVYDLKRIGASVDIENMIFDVGPYVLSVLVVIALMIIFEKMFKTMGIDLMTKRMAQRGKIVSNKTYLDISVLTCLLGIIESLLYMVVLYIGVRGALERESSIMRMSIVASSLVGIGAIFSYCYWLIEYVYNYFLYFKSINLIQYKEVKLEKSE